MWSNWFGNFWHNFVNSPGTSIAGIVGLYHVVASVGSIGALLAMPVAGAVGLVTQVITSVILMGSKGPDFTAGSAAQTAATPK